ncbi:MAG: sigma-70 family RNA polymerase sigma factor [Opitutaceae bacterium]|nr:sigma-70 family RNA polymerase sigma factor [Opitutaceae bacterium]
MPDADAPFDLPACLARVRDRDQSAARELVEHLYPLVIKIVRSHLPRRVLEEDLAQEVFMKMFVRLDQFHGTVPLTHWVSRIAVTTCIDHLRAQRRRPEFRWADLSEDEAAFLDRVATSADATGPDDAMAARELVEKLLGQLKPEDQLVIRLMDLEQLSVAEIGQRTGWNAPLVKVRAFRARRKLRKLFEHLERKEAS